MASIEQLTTRGVNVNLLRPLQKGLVATYEQPRTKQPSAFQTHSKKSWCDGRLTASLMTLGSLSGH